MIDLQQSTNPFYFIPDLTYVKGESWKDRSYSNSARGFFFLIIHVIRRKQEDGKMNFISDSAHHREKIELLKSLLSNSAHHDAANHSCFGMRKNGNDKERASETDACSSTQKPSKTSYVWLTTIYQGWERGRGGGGRILE